MRWTNPRYSCGATFRAKGISYQRRYRSEHDGEKKGNEGSQLHFDRREGTDKSRIHNCFLKAIPYWYHKTILNKEKSHAHI
jgi:hypothetical protein